MMEEGPCPFFRGLKGAVARVSSPVLCEVKDMKNTVDSTVLQWNMEISTMKTSSEQGTLGGNKQNYPDRMGGGYVVKLRTSG